MANNIVFHGNSITAFGGGDSIPSRLATLLGCTVVNKGVGGIGTIENLANFDTDVHANYSEGDTNIVIHWESSNSLLQQVWSTAEEEIANMIAYGTKARSRGWHFIDCTTIQRGTAGYPTLALWRTMVAQVNAWKIANWTSYASQLCMMHEVHSVYDTPFEDDGNETYFRDSAHPTWDIGNPLFTTEAGRAVGEAILDYSEVTLPDSTKRIIHNNRLAGGYPATVYGGAVPYTYEMAGDAIVQVSTPPTIIGNITGS